MSYDPQLEKLKKQIKKVRETTHPHRVYSPAQQTVGKFVNVGVELVSGVFIGTGLGLLLDWLFGTSPWGLIVLFILGSMAGMLNVYRMLLDKDNQQSPFRFLPMSRKTRQGARSTSKYVSTPTHKSDALMGRKRKGIRKKGHV